MEITTLEEFRKIISKNGDSFIVITDEPTGDLIHLVMCKFVKEIDFKTKVIENKSKMGRYYFYTTYKEAKEKIPSISICKYCSKYFQGRT